MAVYQVINKHHDRATMVEQQVIDARGNPFTVLHNGSPQRFEVGALMDDLTPGELAAFPDRFQLVLGEPAGVPAHAGAAKPHLNPELFALVRRAYTGDATADEQAIMGLLLLYLEHEALGTETEEETIAMAAQLEEFGLMLFAPAKEG